MIFRPFFKYLRPHRIRLLIAIVCMVFVGVTTTVPVLMILEVPKVLHIESGVAEEVPAESSAPEESASQDPTALLGDIISFVDLKETAIYQWGEQKIRPVHERYITFRNEKPVSALGLIVAILIFVIFCKGVALFISQYLLAYTFFYINLELSENIFTTVLRQDYLYFNKNSPGLLHSRIIGDCKAIEQVLSIIISTGVQQPVTVVTLFCVMVYLNAKLTLMVMVVLPVVGLMLYFFAKTLRKNTRSVKRKNDQLAATLVESLHNIRLVKAFGTEDVEQEKYRKKRLEIFVYMMRARIAKFGSSPITEFLGVCAIGIAIIYGGTLILEEEMELGMIGAYLYALLSFYRPMKRLADLNSKYQIARVSAERIIEMLSLTPKLNEVENPVPFQTLQNEIRVENLSFCYDEVQILKDMELTARPGQSIAFVGETGSGKTTMLNLIARLFDPTDGRILVDGTDMRELRVADWRKRLAIVAQDRALFDDTVGNNITYGSQQPFDEARMIECAKAAHAHDFVMAMEGGKGYNTRVGSAGSNLSGGQQQRIAIARALYRDPQVLILDEATSALDAGTQSQVQQAIAERMKDRTVFIVAHRISTIRNASCIHFLEHGRIVESGTHEELMALNGRYAQMVAKGEQETEEPTANLLETPLPQIEPVHNPS